MLVYASLLYAASTYHHPSIIITQFFSTEISESNAQEPIQPLTARQSLQGRYSQVLLSSNPGARTRYPYHSVCHPVILVSSMDMGPSHLETQGPGP